MANLAERIRTRLTTGEVSRADAVSLEEFGYLLGRSRGESMRTRAGVVIGTRRTLGLSAWWSGCRYLAETVASLPVHTFRDTAEGRSRRADPPWVRRPDAEQTWFGLCEFLMMSLLNKGNAYAFKVRDAVGRVVGLRELHPDRVTVGQAPDGTKRFLIDRHEPEWTVRDVLHIPGLAYDGRVGMNPIQVHSEGLGIVAASDEYAQRFFGQATHVGGIISVPQDLTDEQAASLRAEWDRFHTGLREAHQTGVLSRGATYASIGLNAADAQLIESRKFGVTEIARILRIPPHKLYDLERATFSNIEHQAIEAVVDSVRPWVERLEAWIDADPDLLPAGNFVEFQLEGLLRGDAKARADFYASGIQNGWLMPSEPRRLENLDRVEGTDYLLRPLNMAVVTPDGETQLPPADEGRSLRVVRDDGGRIVGMERSR